MEAPAGEDCRIEDAGRGEFCVIGRGAIVSGAEGGTIRGREACRLGLARPIAACRDKLENNGGGRGGGRLPG